MSPPSLVPVYEYLLLPWADISLSCVLESVLVCEQVRRKKKRDVLLQMFIILYRIILHLLPFPLVLSCFLCCSEGQISQIIFFFFKYGLHISNYVC